MISPDPANANTLRTTWRKERGVLVWVFVFSVFVNLLMLTGPLYMLAVYDQVLATGSVRTLTALTLLVLVLFLLMGVLDYCRGRVMARFGARFQQHLNTPLFNGVLTQAAGDPSGRKNMGLLRHLEALHDVFLSPALIAVMDMPWAPLFITAIFFLHPWLGWLALAGAAVIIASTVLNQATSSRVARNAQRKAQTAHRFAEDALEAHEVVLAQDMIDTVEARHDNLRHQAQIQQMRASDWTGLFASFSKSFRLFLQSAILGLGAYLVIKGELTAGAMIAASILLGRALAPVEQVLANWPMLLRGRLAWSLLGHFFSELSQQPASSLTHGKHPVLQVKELSVAPPGSNEPTAQGISFFLGPGQVMGVIGPSGSGKSSLAKCLAGVWPAASGDIILPTTEDATTTDWRVGYLPQTVHFLSGTVAENIQHMATEPDEKGVTEAAKRARIHTMILGLPNGYDTFLDGNNNLLSGGQRQRIALARALYGQPDLLVLDEPNSMLDEEGTEALNEAIQWIKHNRKRVVVMTHRPRAIGECDVLLRLVSGRMAAFGPRDAVLEDMYPGNKRIRNLVARNAKP